MNRDEILTKSRAENVMEDERGRLTKWKAPGSPTVSFSFSIAS